MLTRILLLAAGMVMVCEGRAAAQSMMGPRATAIAAYGPLVNDTRDFGFNPAGLTHLLDWEFSATTYLPTTGSIDGFVFHGLTLGKRFLGRHAAAMQFSNGTSLEIVFPAEGIIIGPEPTTVDSRISYSEQFSLAYAYALLPGLSAGIQGRLRQEKVTDTQYRLQDTVIVRLPDVISESNAWNIDAALLWKPRAGWSVSLLGRNLLTINGDPLPEEFAEYQLPRDVVVSAGVSYTSGGITAAAELNTEKQGALGVEAVLADQWSVRGGLYADGKAGPFFTGFGGGVGFTYDFLEIGISYLGFFDDRTHTGMISSSDFDPEGITNLDLNRYTLDRISLSVAARFGNTGTAPLRIEGVTISGPVYPSRAETAAFEPLGFVSVKNVSQHPVTGRVSFFIDAFMSEATESREVYLMPGEEAEIPLTALFDERINASRTTTIRDAVVTVTSSPTREPDDRRQSRVVIHGRNAWNGDVGDLRYFVTPDDPEVIRYSRDVLFAGKERISDVVSSLEPFEKARVLFDALAEEVVYVGDPKLSADVVQYPSETLAMNGGDCDDLTVCYASLLSSVGIPTALIDVVPPDDPGNSHVYLMFDTGIEPEYGSGISDNPKRYVARNNRHGKETIWIPVEPTVTAEGFEAAWKLAAEEYLIDVEINLGLVEGWVRILDVY